MGETVYDDVDETKVDPREMIDHPVQSKATTEALKRPADYYCWEVSIQSITLIIIL